MRDVEMSNGLLPPGYYYGLAPKQIAPMNAPLRRAAALAALSLLLPPVAPASDKTWVELDGQIYGAKPDDRGPLGGGPGYAAVVTAGDHQATSLDDLVAVLKQAKAGDVVFIPGGLEIDLTDMIYIQKLVLEVPAGVTLASDRGHDGSPGAILTSDALDTPVMIRTAGPDVRITGLRIRGPNPKRYLEHHARAQAYGKDYRRYYYKFPTSNGIVAMHPRLEVDNCEISAFAHAGVHLRHGDGHHIHHNSIHHCQYQGLGYGVCHNRASSLTEFNVFDWNRHSIAGTGRRGCGYVARHNLEASESLSHSFDMHGGRDREDGTNIAGTHIEIYNNTFRAKRLPIKIRGVPEEKCEITRNWFVHHADASAAVVAEANTTVADNAYGAEPVAH